MNIQITDRNAKLFKIPGANIKFKNFEGTKWNDGKRSFALEIPVEDGKLAEELGWTNVTWHHKVWNDEESEMVPYFKIKIGQYSPAVYYASEDGRRTQVPFEQLDEDHIDNRRIEYISVYCSMSSSDAQGKTWHSAYANELTVKFEASPFAVEYGEATPF